MAACPFGSYDRRVLHALKKAGYRMVLTSDGGVSTATDWLQARDTVKRTFSPNQVEAILDRRLQLGRRLLDGIRTTLKRFRPPPVKLG